MNLGRSLVLPGDHSQLYRDVVCNMRGSKNQGYLFGGPYNKGYDILGSISGGLCFGKLPYKDDGKRMEATISGFGFGV